MLFETSLSIYRLSFLLEYLIATARKRYLIKTLKTGGNFQWLCNGHVFSLFTHQFFFMKINFIP